MSLEQTNVDIDSAKVLATSLQYTKKEIKKLREELENSPPQTTEVVEGEQGPQGEQGLQGPQGPRATWATRPRATRPRVPLGPRSLGPGALVKA